MSIQTTQQNSLTSLSVERVGLRFQSPSSNLTTLANPSNAFKLPSIWSSCQDYGFEIAGLPASRPPGCRLQESGFQAAGSRTLDSRLLASNSYIIGDLFGRYPPPQAATGRHRPPQAAKPRATLREETSPKTSKLIYLLESWVPPPPPGPPAKKK